MSEQDGMSWHDYLEFVVIGKESGNPILLIPEKPVHTSG